MTGGDHRAVEDVFHGTRPWRTVRLLYAGQRGRLAVAATAFALKHSPVWVMPLLTANVIDGVVTGRPLRVLWLNAGLMVLLIVANVPLTTVYAGWLSKAVRSVETELRAGLCQRLQQLSIGYHRRMSAGVLQAKVIRDVENVVESSRQTFDAGMAALTTCLGAVVLTATRVPEFLPVFLVAVPAAAWLVTAMRGRMNARNTAFRHTIEALSARVSEMTHLIPITRAHALERDELDRIDASLRDVRYQGVRLDMLNGRFTAVAWVLFQLLSVACLVGAAWAASTGVFDVTAGDVVLLTSYFAVLTGSMIMLLGLAPVVTRGLESIRSMGEVFVEPDLEVNDGKHVVRGVAGRITFEHVGLAYPDAAGPALVDVSLDVAAGETVALVGPSGAGKSSLINLVIGFLAPSSGRVLVDGRDMAELDLRSYRRHLAVVPQESMLFEGTVRDNVTYGQAELRDVDVRRALTVANAWDFVAAMGGLDAVVGERGAALSGGQRQRLAIARAMIRDPRVLILDEATSALDQASEAQVQQALGRLMQSRTTFVVAHRLATVRNADRIVVLHDGAVVQTGTHDELMAEPGMYGEMYAAGVRPGSTA